MGSKSDPIASLLDDEKEVKFSPVGHVERHFGDRPAVLASIHAAIRRGIPKTIIARQLTKGLRAEGVDAVISPGQVSTWLNKNPI